MTKPTLILSLLCLFFSVSCNSDSLFSSSDLSTNLDINTNKESYTPTDTVTVSFINDTNVDIMLLSDGCRAFGAPLPNLRIEKQDGGTWNNVTSYNCSALYQQPIEIESGASYSISFRVGILNQPLEEGTYRYRFDLRLIKEGQPGEKLPERNRYSNEFEVLNT